MDRDGSCFVNGLLSKLRPEGILLAGFALAITMGAFVLWLPPSHGDNVGLFDAVFTATSAVCVTGLVVVDTGADFTFFGQVVILILIQMGGLGVMTFAALAFDLLGRRMSLGGQEAMTTALVHEGVARGFRQHFQAMLRLIVGFEAAGALLLFVAMAPSMGTGRAAYSAAFHSVSAFCNAGFSLYADSLVGLRENAVVVWTVALLIIVGGIGQPVLLDLWTTLWVRRRHVPALERRMTVHTRVTAATTAVLLAGGAALLFVTGPADGSHNAAGAVFQSVTARTAGFNTIAIDRLPLASLLVLTVLMFIGGSPGSCAGGVKTTTFALWGSQLWCRLRGRKGVVLCERYIAQPLVRRSATIVSLALIWNAAGVFVLSMSEGGRAGVGLHDLLFEQVSAFGTVGLSTGLTPTLSAGGKLWIMLTMFVGRTGPLASVLLLLRTRPSEVRYPEGKVMIG